MDGMTTPAESRAPEIRAYIIDRFLFGQDVGGLSDDESFLDRGLIDSTGILEVVAYLEQRYGISVSDDELIPENLDSIGRIARFVASKQR